MQQLCLTGNYRRRFARVKEFCNEKAEFVLDAFLKEFCNIWLEEEFTMQSGAQWYERSSTREDDRAGHYRRSIVTGRGVMDLEVPRGVKKKYEYTLFKRFKRKTAYFEDIVIDALLKGHSSRKASRFFASMFGRDTISHQAAVQTLRRFDRGLEQWKKRPIRKQIIPVTVYLIPELFTPCYAQGHPGRRVQISVRFKRPALRVNFPHIQLQEKFR